MRLLAKEIVRGDRRKFQAKSNDADTGGGARDLRLRPESAFTGVLGRLFPARKPVRRTIRGKAISLIAWSGVFHWHDDAGRHHRAEAEVWPPTNARKGELRLVRVHDYGCFRHVPPESEGRLFLLVIQTEAGELWPRFATERSLEEDDWDAEVAAFLLGCLRARRRGDVSACGFLDLETGERYVNGR